MTTPKNQMITLSAYPFEETLTLLRQAIGSQDFWLLHKIDTQQIVRKAGVVTDGIRQLLFFHPRYIAQILEKNADAVIEAPLKLLIMERPEGKTTVSTFLPTSLFGHYDGLQEMGIELESAVKIIISQISA